MRTTDTMDALFLRESAALRSSTWVRGPVWDGIWMLNALWLVPLVLWLAFREHRGRAIEWATWALWLVLAVFVFHGIIAHRFFL